VVSIGVLAKSKRAFIVAVSLGYLVVRTCVEWVRRVGCAQERRRCVVLYYHGVSDGQRERFRRQLAYLRSHVAVIRLVDAHPQGPRSRSVVLTFDDGLANLARNVVPPLIEQAVPATFFVVTHRLGRSASWAMETGCEESGQRVLTRRALCRLPYPQFDIGSHTVTHVDLATVDMERASQELTESREQLEALLGRPVRSVSFPYGSYDDRVVQLAKNAGYVRIVTCEPRTATSPDSVIGRFRASPDDWMIELHLKVLGAYSWLYYAQRMKRAGRRLLQWMLLGRRRSRTHVPASVT